MVLDQAIAAMLLQAYPLSLLTGMVDSRSLVYASAPETTTFSCCSIFLTLSGFAVQIPGSALLQARQDA
jgi:hypothetical protein